MSRGHGRPDLVQHGFLAVTDLLCAEAHETALLGGLGSCLRSSDQPPPERRSFVDQFSQQIHRYDDRHRVKVGITGWAQIHGLRGRTSLEDRVEWDNFYIDNWSPWLDVKTLLVTFAALRRGYRDPDEL